MAALNNYTTGKNLTIVDATDLDDEQFDAIFSSVGSQWSFASVMLLVAVFLLLAMVA